jgi:phosphoglycolate phosphatase
MVRVSLSNAWLKSMEHVVIFDLDGTLVDSSAGILASLDHAFRANEVAPTGELSNFIIGPPVREIVDSLSPGLEASTTDMIIESFKSHYDSSGYLRTVPYDGIDQMLRRIINAGVRLAIVTNKREVPTKLIVNLLGWNNYFSSIYCPDSVQPSSRTKAALIGKLLFDTDLNPLDCVYIGDRTEDWHSSRVNGIRFGWAEWGYSLQKPDFNDDSFILTVPDENTILTSMNNPMKFRCESLCSDRELIQDSKTVDGRLDVCGPWPRGE